MKSPNDTFAVIAPNLVVSGNLISEGNVHVDGAVEGDIQTVHLTIGSGGIVRGRIYGQEVKISGRVEGSVTARELILEESAVVDGDLHYQSLLVSRGAQLNGACHFSEAELDIMVLSRKQGQDYEKHSGFGVATDGAGSDDVA